MEEKKTNEAIIVCSEETMRTIQKWRVHFQYVYKRDFTYEDIIRRSMEALPIIELEVANSLRKWELVNAHKEQLLIKKKKR